jgi:hypothetical protein
VEVLPLYSIILVPFGIKILVNNPLPELGMVERFTTNSFSNSAILKLKIFKAANYLYTLNIADKKLIPHPFVVAMAASRRWQLQIKNPANSVSGINP